MNKKDFWIGIGVGVGAGLAGGFLIGNQVQKKKARREFKRVRKEAYMRGAEDMSAEAERLQNKLDELESSVVWVNPTDTKEEIEKKIQDHYEKKEEPGKSDGKNAATSIVDEDPTPGAYINDNAYAKKESSVPEVRYPFTVSGNNVIFYGVAGTELRYPRYLVMNKRGELLDEMEMRSNIQSYESDARKLMIIWHTMGWGAYIPGESMQTSALDEFDDEEKTYGDEPEIKTREREKYLDEVERYISHPEDAPRVISRADFDDENYLDKINIDYFDVDNVFIENSDASKPIDAVTLLGTNDGQELFQHKMFTDDDSDPDIIYVKNFGMNCVVEVTRFHKSYQSVRDGSAYVNGCTA